jgi:hypothetical protein
MRLAHAAALSAPTACGIFGDGTISTWQGEMFASPLNVNADTTIYFSAHDRDRIFGARINAFSQRWTGAVEFNPEYVAEDMHRAVQHALISVFPITPTGLSSSFSSPTRLAWKRFTRLLGRRASERHWHSTPSPSSTLANNDELKTQITLLFSTQSSLPHQVTLCLIEHRRPTRVGYGSFVLRASSTRMRV